MSYYFVAIFKGDDLFLADSENTFVYRTPEKTIPDGDYMILKFHADFIGNRRGLVSAKVARIQVKEPITYLGLFDNLFGQRLETSDPNAEKHKITVTDLGMDALSESQRKSAIDALNRFDVWALRNATQDAKASLKLEYSKKDKARELTGKATAIWQEKQDYDEAVRLLNEAIQMYTEIDGARNELGKLAIEMRDANGATRWFQDELSLANEPKALTAHSYLAAIFEAQGDVQQAQLHAQAAMDTDTYRQAPSALSADVIAKIRKAVSNK
jgi:tetratricopeptide (TPR) repeat protein